MRRRLFSVYERLRSWLAPQLRYSQSIYEEILHAQIPKGGRWLDLGCGRKLLPEWREHQEQMLIARGFVVGLDYDSHSLHKHRSIEGLVRGDISRLPFGDEVFDVVTANMVFEHLRDPERQLREASRVLKPGGTLIFHTPNVWGYTTVLSMLLPERVKGWLIKLLENREEADVFKTYYRINSLRAIERAAAGSGMRTEEIRMIVTDAQFAIVPLVALFELLWIRLLMFRGMKMARTNIIARLRKPAASAASGREAA